MSKQNRGQYVCTATNSEGTGRSSANLYVRYSPTCKSGQKLLYGAAKMETVRIECEVEADPSEVTFQWGFNTSNENFEILNYETYGLKSIATFKPVNEYSYGTVWCLAKNSIGTQINPCIYTVIPAGPPDQVQNCTLVNQTESSIQVDCTEGYDGGLSQQFTMEVYDNFYQKIITNLTTSRPLFIAKGLLPGRAYVVHIFSFNTKGKSKSLTLSVSTLEMPKSLTRMGKGKLIVYNAKTDLCQLHKPILRIPYAKAIDQIVAS